MIMLNKLMLVAVVILETSGTSLLKATRGFTQWKPSIVCVLCYAIGYYLFAKVLMNMELGRAYALWCGFGIILSTAVSVLVYKEKLNFMGGLGILLVLIGCVFVELGKA